MPWKETLPMHERERFYKDRRRGLYTMTELCQRYGISRKTGYKWEARILKKGAGGFVDEKRTPHSCPHKTKPEIRSLILGARRAHPTWGPEKILDYLAPRYEELVLPAISTAGDLLKRENLTKKRPRRQKPVHPGMVPAVTEGPNDLWAADFKGQFRMRNGVYCYPLTVTDLHSRYLLECLGLLSTKGDAVKAAFDRLFREFGLPRAIRTDNGVPFATTGIHGLSKLNVWWMRLGIVHQRILPGKPQQNGSHERMHKTLKAEALRPPQASLPSQQKALDAFRTEFNEERPHHSLAGKTPSSQYRPSTRPYNGKLPPLEYPGHYLVKRVTEGGTVRLKQGRLLYVATALVGHHIGFEETADGIWSVFFSNTLLGRVDEKENILRF
jgi:putative transposase